MTLFFFLQFSCEKIRSKNENEPEVILYTKENKIKMANELINKLVAALTDSSDLSTLQVFCDENSRFSGNIGDTDATFNGRFLDGKLKALNKNISVKEVIRLINTGHRENGKNGDGVWFSLFSDGFEYGLGLAFNEKQRKWVIRSLFKDKPER